MREEGDTSILLKTHIESYVKWCRRRTLRFNDRMKEAAAEDLILAAR
jgi:hypothetical protein